MMLVTFGLTVFAWVFFRAENIEHAISYISEIFSKSLFTIPRFGGGSSALITILLVIGFILVEWFGREQQYALFKLGLNWPKPIRWSLYCVLVLVTLLYSGQEQAFIYFQF